MKGINTAGLGNCRALRLWRLPQQSANLRFGGVLTPALTALVRSCPSIAMHGALGRDAHFACQ